MYIFLGIIGELATIVGTLAITFNAAIDSTLEIPKNGYKIDKRVVDKYKKEENKNEFRRLLGIILLLFPGVNLINAKIKGYKLKKSIMNNPKIKEALIPMTDREKREYASLEDKFEKVYFATCTITKNEKEDMLGFTGTSLVDENNALTVLNHGELLPLEYTLEEVERLNRATGYSYRIGKSCNKNIAIIGIPDSERPVDMIRLKFENYLRTYDYRQLSREEAQDKTFTVYPFAIDNITKERLQKVIEEIKQSRIDKATNENLKALQAPIQIADKEEGVSKTDEQEGLVLKRSLKQTNDKK